MFKEQAFADLIEYGESQRASGAVFKISALAQMYSSLLSSLGDEENVHSTRLRHKMTAAAQDLIHIEVKGLSNRTDAYHFPGTLKVCCNVVKHLIETPLCIIKTVITIHH